MRKMLCAILILGFLSVPGAGASNFRGKLTPDLDAKIQAVVATATALMQTEEKQVATLDKVDEEIKKYVDILLSLQSKSLQRIKELAGEIRNTKECDALQLYRINRNALDLALGAQTLETLFVQTYHIESQVQTSNANSALRVAIRAFDPYVVASIKGDDKTTMKLWESNKACPQ